MTRRRVLAGPDARDSLDARTLVRSAWWMSGAHMTAQLAAYASLLIVARLIAPGAIGAAATGTAILFIGAALMDAGTRGSIIVTSELRRSFVFRSLTRCVIAGAAIFGALALASGPISRTFASHTSPSVLATLGLGVPLYAFATVPLAVLQRAMAFRDMARAWALANIVSSVTAVAAAALGAGVWSLVARQLAWGGVLAVLAWYFAAPHLPAADAAAPAGRRPPPARWFMLFAVSQVLTLNLDYLIIGNTQTARELGLYTLAFMVAFAPVQHFSAHVGKVLFAAAAASGAELSGSRTVTATRLMAVLFLPLLPVAVVLAPPLLPTLLGAKWTGMVVPFQLLVVAGVGYAIVNCIGEALSGGGQAAFRAKTNVVWCLTLLIALVALVHLDGIRGAAFAQVGVFALYALVYTTLGARRAGTTAADLWRALRVVIMALALQSAATWGSLVALENAGAPHGLAAVLAAAFGAALMVATATRGRSAPLREAFATVRMASRSAAL
jgi:O-antigen/teichoic acid export membrane protein